MKKLLHFFVFAAAFAVSAQSIWNGEISSVRHSAYKHSPQFTADGGALNIKASMNIPAGKHEYFAFSINVSAFSLQEKSLSFHFTTRQVDPRDIFYVKARNASGQVVGSFYTRITQSTSRTYICTTGRDGGGMTYFASDVKGPAGDPVVKLDFFYCRHDGNNALDLTLSDIKIIPHPPVELWNGQLSSVSSTTPKFSPQFSIDGDMLNIRTSFDIQKHEYFIFDVKVNPFSLQEKSLSFQFASPQLLAGDMLYIKALDASGQVVGSFYTRLSNGNMRTYVCTPESDTGGVTYFASDVKAPITNPVVKLRFFYCRMAGKNTMDLAVGKFELVPHPPRVPTVKARDLGFAVRGGTCRGLHTAKDADGNDCVVVFLMDDINRRMLQISAVTGQCDETVLPFRPRDAVYSSIKGSNGKSYSLFAHHFVEYDPAQKKFTFVRQVKDLCAMSMAEDNNGVIYAATYPDLCLYSYDPATGEFKDFGQLHKETFAQYPRSITIADDNTVYIGTGSTRGQAIHVYPDSGRVVALIPKAEEPAGKSLFVRRFTDGNIYARHLDLFFRIDGDNAVKLDSVPDAQMILSPFTGSQNLVIRDFDSGRKLVSIDFATGKLVTSAADGSDRREVTFSFTNHGSPMMGVDVTADGIVGGGGFFPFCFGLLYPESGEKTIQAADVQCNAIQAHGKYFYIAGYSGGIIMRFDPDKPWDLTNPMHRTQPDLQSNPVFYGSARRVFIRPHAIAVSPDGRYFVSGGTPEYGHTGGGIAIVDTQSGEMTLVPHTELAPLESPHALAVTDAGLILCGTTIQSGTGGEVKATEASLFIYDIHARKTIWRSKELGSVQDILQFIRLDDSRFMGFTSARELFIFDLDSRRVTVRQDISEIGTPARGQACRTLVSDGEGGIWFIGTSYVAQIDPSNCRILRKAKIDGGIQTGGAIYRGILYFVAGHRWKSIDLKEIFK